MATKMINSLNMGGNVGVFTIPYGTCSTTAGTVAKTVAVPGNYFSLETGAMVLVKFTVTNTAANPTLNVSSTGAKAIMYRGSAITKSYLAANRVYLFVYDGTDWELIGDINTDANTQYSAGNGLTLSNTTFNVGAGTGISVAADTVGLANSGVTAGTYGPTAAATPAYGATFNVPSVTVDATGRVTSAATYTVKIPASDKVTVDTAMSSSSTNPVQNKVVNTALGAKAALASPTFTGTPKAPTASAGTNNTQIATTAFVNTHVTNALSSFSTKPYAAGTTAPTNTNLFWVDTTDSRNPVLKYYTGSAWVALSAVWGG